MKPSPASVLCARSPRGRAVQSMFGELAESVGDLVLTLITAVQIDQCGPRCGVPHAVHQLAQSSASIRREGVPGVPQIMEMDHWQTGSAESGIPDPAPEVAVPQWLAL